MGKLSFENRFDVSGSATARRLDYERAQVVGQRKVGFIRHRQHVSDLGGRNLVGDAFASFEADALGGDRPQAAAIV